jgi:integrase
MSSKEIIKNFSSNYLNKTTKSQAVAILNDFIDEIKIKKLSSLKINHLIKYRDILIANKYKPATIQQKFSFIKSFLDYLVGENMIDNNPTSKVNLPKIKKQNHARNNTITSIEAKKVLDATDNERDYLIIWFALFLGLRRSEIAGLKVKDISYGLIKINGKGDKDREVPIPYSIADKCRKIAGDKYIFQGQGKAKHIAAMTVYRIVTKLCFKRLGKHVYPHAARASFATNALSKTQNVVDIGRIMGHSSPKTTMLYDSSDSNQLKNTMRDFWD